MTQYFSWLASAVIIGALSACGGGGDAGGGGGGGGGGPGAPGAPPVVGAPTAVLTGSQQTAAALSDAANAGALALDTVDGFSALPLGVQVTIPTGVTTTDTVVCSGGGSALVTANSANLNNVTVGDSARLVFSSCVELGYTTSGIVDFSITRFVNQDNFTSLFDATGLMVSQAGVTRGPASFSGQVALTNGAVAFSYSVNGATVIGNGVITRNANSVTIAIGTTRVNLPSGGFVEVRYNGWVFDRVSGLPSAGTATVTAANGDQATVAIAVDGYHWTITAGGIVTNRTDPF